MEKNKEVILSVKDLKINFATDHGYVQAVRNVSFDLHKGETLCIVGESGSGKSVTSKAIMGILSANGRIMNGSIMYEGEDLTKVSEDEFHRIRGHKIGMIFQDPLSSLNPIVRIGKQITEAMLVNASRLKRLYEEKVAPELVAYKNAETEYHLALNAGKEKVKFLKGEKKKEIRKIKDNPSMISEGKLYTASIDYNSEKIDIKEKYKELKIPYLDQLKALDAQEKQELREIKVGGIEDISLRSDEVKSKYLELRAPLNEQLNRLEEELRQELEALKGKYSEFKQEVTGDKKEAKKLIPELVRSKKEKFDREIDEARVLSQNERESLKEKYKPLIKEAKAKYRVRSKEAHAEVREYKHDLKEKYSNEKYEINHSVMSDAEKSEALDKAKEKYISAIRITKAEAKARALKIMKEVGISEPEKRYKQYPFEFSGGMRQRIVIAIALTADPDILICDEPTTALDVTIQAQILELINRLKKERNISCIFITHDLGVVANMADRVAVMYAGKIVEYGTEKEIFYDPKHPYTWALLSSIPDVNSKEKLDAIPGTPPNMIYPPVGDAFALRSKYAMAIDFKKEPPFFKVSDTHYAATWLLDPRAPKVEMPKIVKTRIENSLKNAPKGGDK